MKRVRSEFLVASMTTTTELHANKDPSWDPTEVSDNAVEISCKIKREAMLSIT